MQFTSTRKAAMADAEWILTGQLRIAGRPVGPTFEMVYSDAQVVGTNDDVGHLIVARLHERGTALKPKGTKKARKETTKGTRA